MARITVNTESGEKTRETVNNPTGKGDLVPGRGAAVAAAVERDGGMVTTGGEVDDSDAR